MDRFVLLLLLSISYWPANVLWWRAAKATFIPTGMAGSSHLLIDNLYRIYNSVLAMWVYDISTIKSTRYWPLLLLCAAIANTSHPHQTCRPPTHTHIGFAIFGHNTDFKTSLFLTGIVRIQWKANTLSVMMLTHL